MPTAILHDAAGRPCGSRPAEAVGGWADALPALHAVCPEVVLIRGPGRAAMSAASDSPLDVLMTRLALGDRSAFAPVFEHLWPRALRLCASMLKHEADAADAAQQAMMKILERASEYDRRRPALPWALAIASWECRTVLKRRLRRREVADETVGTSTVGDEEEHIQRQLVEAALAAMGTLSDLDKETLIATFWEVSASAHGATLRKRRERAVDRLRAAFRRLYGLD